MEELNSRSYSETLNLFANELQRPFWYCQQNLHRFIANPLKENWSETHSLAMQYFRVATYGLGTALGGLPVVASAVLKGVSRYFQRRDFIYVEGKGEEVRPKTPHFHHLNVCMFPGGLPMSFGKMRPAGERREELKAFLERVNPDLFFLSEFSQTMTSKLVEDFQDQYRHFFVNIGTNPLGMDASFAVVSRQRILGVPEFYPSKAVPEGDQKGMLRGFFHIETPEAHYLYVHLHPKNSERAKDVRKEQLGEVEALIKNPETKPWVVLGDFNIERGSDEYRSLMERGFQDVLAEQHGEKVETCIDIIEKGSEEKPESIDMILVKGDLQVQAELHETYQDREHPLSDHKGLSGKLLAD